MKFFNKNKKNKGQDNMQNHAVEPQGVVASQPQGQGIAQGVTTSYGQATGHEQMVSATGANVQGLNKKEAKALLKRQKQLQKEKEREELAIAPKTREPHFTWDLENRYLIARSEKRAWMCCKIAISGFVLAIVALMLLVPLKTVVPYVIRVNEASGMTDIVKMENFKLTDRDEALTKYFLSKFVLSRESYNFTQLEEDFYVTRELSMPTVFKPYADMYTGPDDLQKKYKDTKRIDVKIKSIIDNHATKVATVRFSTTFSDAKQNTELKTSHYVAQIAYDFYPQVTTTEERRLINPLGFKVMDYRVNPEMN